jgi:hypothetical protein
VRRSAAALLVAAVSTTAAAEGLPIGERSAALRDWIATAETQLSQGRAVEAAQGFDRAANSEHAADIEAGLVRSYLQNGEFRRALAFASHTAGAHRDKSIGTALYVWLLQLSGQREFGQRLLQQARERLPQDTLLAEVDSQLGSATPRVTLTMLEAPARLAPYPAGEPVPDQARVVASGLLVDNGRQALVPASALEGAQQVWLRDGAGRTWPAVMQQRQLKNLPLAVVALQRAADDAPALQAVPRDAFPGSPGYAVAYTGAGEATPAWPWLRPGFLGNFDMASGQRRLGIELPSNALPGGPVFDVAGRLVGLSSAGGRLLPVSSLQAELPALLAAAPSEAPAARLATDELYERAMKATLQVIVLR